MRLECEVLQKVRYINTLTFTFHNSEPALYTSVIDTDTDIVEVK